jgi:AcrR family transcriptional regulator
VSTRPGGRSERVRADVLAATYAELAERGYPSLTVENIAERAGVHKTTVYRRWGSVDVLIADALDDTRGTPWPLPDTGSIEGDLIAIAEEVAQAATGVPEAVVAAAFHSTRAAQALHEFYVDRHEQAAQVVVRAVERGELPATVDAVELIRLTCAPVYYRAYMSREPVDEAVVQRSARAALAAARAGVI